MNHPNIAQVYDASTTAKGRLYFVMEYIDGEPITKYCDRHRLNTRQRLELFVGNLDGSIRAPPTKLSGPVEVIWNSEIVWAVAG
jgi:serine/threonine protein kinase